MCFATQPSLPLPSACREEEVVARSPSAAQARSARGSSSSLSVSAAAARGSSADGGPAVDGSGTPKAAGAGAGAGDTAGGDALSRKRAYKEKWQEGVALFNKKPKKGIAMLQVGTQIGAGHDKLQAHVEDQKRSTAGQVWVWVRSRVCRRSWLCASAAKHAGASCEARAPKVQPLPADRPYGRLCCRQPLHPSSPPAGRGDAGRHP